MVQSKFSITKEQYIERETLKSFYNNPIGIQELCDIARAGGLLSKITPLDDTKMVLAHNWAVEKLERLGLLDEEGLEDLIRYLLTRQPTKLPADV